MRKQRKAIQKAIQQATDIQNMYQQAGLTPDQVSQINAQIPNIGGATQQQIAAASTGVGGQGYTPDYQTGTDGMSYDQGYGDDVYNATADDGSGFLEQLEILKRDPIYSMVRYNKMVGKGSEGGKNYSEKWEQESYFENYEGDGLAGLIGSDIDAIIGQFSKNWEDNKPATFNPSENFFGFHLFKKINKKTDELAGDKGEDSFEIGDTVMNFLPVLIAAYLGYMWYGTTGLLFGAVIGWFIHEQFKSAPTATK